MRSVRLQNAEFNSIQFNEMGCKPKKSFNGIETMAQGEREKKKTDSENLVYDILNMGYRLTDLGTSHNLLSRFTY